MQDPASTLVKSYLDDPHLIRFAHQLTEWLMVNLSQSDEKIQSFNESRAGALLRAAEAIDDPTLHSFTGLMANDTAVRIALHDLLVQSGYLDR